MAVKDKNNIVQVFVGVILIVILGGVATIMFNTMGGDGTGRETFYYNTNYGFSENQFDGKAFGWDNISATQAVIAWSNSGYVTITENDNGIGYLHGTLTMVADNVDDRVTRAIQQISYRVRDNDNVASIMVTFKVDNGTAASDNITIWTENAYNKKSTDWTTVDNTAGLNAVALGDQTYNVWVTVDIKTGATGATKQGNTVVDITTAKLGVAGYTNSFSEDIKPTLTTFVPIMLVLAFVSLLVYAAFMLVKHLGIVQ